MDAPNRRDWQRVLTIFKKVADLSRDEREEVLADSCRDEPLLRAEVEKLLTADAAAGDFLAQPAAAYAAVFARDGQAADREAAPAHEGRRIGAYRLLKEIGKGGMGTVHLAERVDGHFDHQVAFKLLKRGMDSDEILQRFLQERQILARFNHPNIASLRDGGLSDDGVPYFVLEYVAGRPVTHYCDDNDLDVAARLRLFLQICRGVEYAHRNLVVHRDLKPSNILVTDDGTVKLLDFGVAKLLAENDGAALTRTTSRMLTPQYAAPEQIRGEPVTTATDVYALGVVLYELLTGRRPHGDPAGFGATEHTILEVDPVRPSVATRGRFARRLRGDVDNIVLAALEKNPDDRYPSAEAFARDIERHLADLPIRARSQSYAYRARKFVRRHLLGVGAAAMIVLALLGGWLLTAHQGRETARQARKAEAVKDFLVDLFALADPEQSRGEAITPLQMVDRGAERVATELAAQPEVQAEILAVLGRSYHRLGVDDRARELLEHAATLQRRHLGDRDLRLAQTLNWLATVLQTQAVYETAEDHFREALRIRRAALGDEHREVAQALNDLAVLLSKAGDLDGAELLHSEALALKRRLFAGDHTTIAASLHNLALLTVQRGDFATADTLYREALAIRREAFGNESLPVANTLNNLMVMHRRQSDHEAAEPLAREALAIRRRLLGDSHPDVAYSLFNLAAIQRARGDRVQAELLFREAIDVAVIALGEDHPDIGGMRNVMAAFLRESGDLSGAESMAREALEQVRGALPDDHPLVATILLELGRTLMAQNRPRDAHPLLRDATSIRERKLGVASSITAEAQLALGICLHETGRREEAEVVLANCLAASANSLGETHELTRRAAEALADLRAARRFPTSR